MTVSTIGGRVRSPCRATNNGLESHFFRLIKILVPRHLRIKLSELLYLIAVETTNLAQTICIHIHMFNGPSVV